MTQSNESARLQLEDAIFGRIDFPRRQEGGNCYFILVAPGIIRILALLIRISSKSIAASGQEYLRLSIMLLK